MNPIRQHRWGAGLALGLLAVGCAGTSGAQQNPDGLVAVPVGGTAVRVLLGGDLHLDLGFIGWGPNWGWAGLEGLPGPADPGRVGGTMRLGTGATLKLSGSFRKTGSRGMTLDLELSTDRDTDLTGFMVGVGPDGYAGGTARAAGEPIRLPMQMQGLGEKVGSFTLTDASGKATQFTLDPPRKITSDGGLRIVLAENRFLAAQPVRQRITVTLPEPFATLSELKETGSTEGWFPFLTGVVGKGKDELDLSAWLPKPAGKAGRILAQGDRLVQGGKPVKIWGINLCYSDCAPPKELADKRAAFYARNGINAVRLHKYADGPGWAGIQSGGSFEKFDPEALDRMDYFVAKLKEMGIYVKLSPTFGVALGPEDVAAVPYLKEFGAVPPPGDRVRTGHGSIFLSAELQKLQIAQTVRLLKHRNPYTGLTYAQDPAVMLVEMFNEDSALFFGTMDRLQRIPTLRARTGAAFAAWLRKKYGSEAALKKAWGNDSLNTFVGEGFTDENWAKGVIYPVGNPWFFDPDQLEGSQKPRKPRLLDTMAFLKGLQDDFYARFRTAIRATGYGGEMMASNWIAGRAVSHFMNLHSDAQIGLVDRHNYFGGGNDTLIDDNTMLRRPGSGILSMGMSQVANRPFSLSEWIHVWPNEWGAEGVAILGTYGMGLQGWDVSFPFQNRDDGTYSDRIGRDQWDVVAPQVMGLFPAVSRQVLRGDVKESDLLIPRYVDLPGLRQGRLGFDDRGDASGDIKTADSATVPVEALAVGRTVVDFVPAAKPTPRFDPKAHLKGGGIVSSTGQLAWFSAPERQSGWFTVNTPGTQALVGFAKGRTASLADLEWSNESGFAALYATAQGPAETLKSARRWIVTALARARNTGQQVVGPLLLNRGNPPILMEPVRATLRVKRGGVVRVEVLDAEGRRTGKTVPIQNGVIQLDTGRDRSVNYLVEFGGR